MKLEVGGSKKPQLWQKATRRRTQERLTGSPVGQASDAARRLFPVSWRMASPAANEHERAHGYVRCVTWCKHLR